MPNRTSGRSTREKVKVHVAIPRSTPLEALNRGSEYAMSLRAGFNEPAHDPDSAETPGARREGQALRQERRTFDQRKNEARWWFRLKFTMAVLAALLLLAIAVTALWVVWHPSRYEPSVVATAWSVLSVQVLAAMAGIWKSLFSNPPAELEPVTRAPDDSPD